MAERKWTITASSKYSYLLDELQVDIEQLMDRVTKYARNNTIHIDIIEEVPES